VATSDGSLWACDYGDFSDFPVIYRVDSAAETIASYPLDAFSYGFPTFYLTVGPDGNVWYTDLYTPTIGRVSASNPAVTYSISAIGDQIMTTLHTGYPSGGQETKTIFITRTGTGDLNNLAVALSGINAASFSVSQPKENRLNDSTNSTNFTIKANDGLAEGMYTATVTVSANYMEAVTFTVTQQVTAETAPTAPAVTTGATSNITVSSATLSGDVTSDGGTEVTERGFVYGTSENPTIGDSKVTAALGSGTGAFSATLSGLTAGTAYPVRAYAKSGAGTAYGADSVFTTQAGR
jgi:hypothetical protein